MGKYLFSLVVFVTKFTGGAPDSAPSAERQSRAAVRMRVEGRDLQLQRLSVLVHFTLVGHCEKVATRSQFQAQPKQHLYLKLKPT